MLSPVGANGKKSKVSKASSIARETCPVLAHRTGRGDQFAQIGADKADFDRNDVGHSPRHVDRDN